MRKCTRCGIEKPLSEYYKGARYKDGHQRICKECQKASMRALEKTESRQDTYKRYRESEKGRESRRMAAKRYREKYPEKIKAHIEISKAKRNGAIEVKPCEVCGHMKVECHHDDYSKPAYVRFLCKKHHDDEHRS